MPQLFSEDGTISQQKRACLSPWSYESTYVIFAPCSRSHLVAANFALQAGDLSK